MLYYDIVLCARRRGCARARLHAFQWTVVISVCFDLTFSCSLCLLLSSPPPPFPSSYVHLLCRALDCPTIVVLCVVCRLTSYWNTRRDIIIFTCCLYGDNRVPYVYTRQLQTSLCLLSLLHHSLRLRLFTFSTFTLNILSPHFHSFLPSFPFPPPLLLSSHTCDCRAGLSSYWSQLIETLSNVGTHVLSAMDYTMNSMKMRLHESYYLLVAW